MAGKAFSRAVRKTHILMSFENRYRNKKREEVTSSQVARALMLEPSAHVRGLLAELVRDGALDCRMCDDKRANNLKGDHSQIAYYQLSKREIARIEDSAREIKLKVGGKEVEQLRML